MSGFPPPFLSLFKGDLPTPFLSLFKGEDQGEG